MAKKSAARESRKAVDELATAAVREHHAGRVEEAKKLYLQALEKDLGHAQSLYGLGVIAYQAAAYETAARMLQRAVAASGAVAAYRAALGAALHAVGKLDEALAEYRHALTLEPEDETTHFRLGNLLVDQGKPQEARAAYEKALSLKPDYAEAHNNLAVLLREEGRLEEATLHCKQALALKPEYAEAHTNMGNVLADQGRSDEAIAHHRRAITLNPNAVDAHINLGHVLRGQGKFEEARINLQQALALRPDSAEAQNNLGSVFEDQGQLEEACIHFRRAIVLQPSYVEAHNNLGNVFRKQAQYTEARHSYDQALALRPGYVEALWNRSLLELLLGNYPEGWRDYEVRSRRTSHRPREFPQPLWRGEPLGGARILLHSEQGLGDALQFLRYVPMVQAAGGTVLLSVPPGLQRLAAPLVSDPLFLASDLAVTPECLPAFELQCPLMSLPLAFQTTVHSIPAEVPYLTIPDDALRRAEDFQWPSEGLRVGLVWSGNRQHANDRFRSMRPETLAPLLSLENIHFFSLQVDVSAESLKNLPAYVTDLRPFITDMADTAALVSHLDLLITVDTAMAHLAGALAKPTWVLLSFAPDWRWLTDREDSPWYPTLRLFRQPQFDDWRSVLQRVRVELSAFAEKNGA
jgi:tetratricopeptide (TPR) repeat protein